MRIRRREPTEKLYRGTRTGPRFDLYERAYQWKRRLGVTGLVSLGALLLIALGMVALELGVSNRNESRLRDFVADQGAEPVAFVADQARARRLLFLSDIQGAGAPKRIAAAAVQSIALGSGLDALVLEVPSDLQPIIDRYVNSTPEDAALLLSRPELLREWAGASDDYLAIYRTVWRVNQRLGPGRSIRIVAADLPGWKADAALAPRAVAEMHARRAAHIAGTVQSSILQPYPRARVLLFVDGYQALRGAGATFQSGGSDPVHVRWAAGRLAARYPAETYSVLIEGATRAARTSRIAGYEGTRFRDVLAGTKPGAVPVGQAFAWMANPVHALAGTGSEMTILPNGYRLGDVADAYILPGGY